MAEEFPLMLMSGTKIRNFFHSEYRQIEELRRGNPDPLVEIHLDTAAIGIKEGEWVWVESPEARVKMRARLFGGIVPDVVNAHTPGGSRKRNRPVTTGKNPG